MWKKPFIFIYIIRASPWVQLSPSVSHGEEPGVALNAAYSLVSSTFFLYCISNTDMASGILADRSRKQISGFPMNRCLTVISYGLCTLISSTSLRSKRWRSWRFVSRTSSEETSTDRHPGFKSAFPPWVTTAGMLAITLLLPDPVAAADAAEGAALAASSALASCWDFQGSLPKGHQEGDSSSNKSLQQS